ncbi:unnamed protein product [Mytilus edulis]|uniref:Uncharacterized protein n=1 Tax=Mytilus edulis TaxID=6550 RepID=A0A8S3R9G3_MYTED|nr:unnamed protein product [Mytilus edulis]
MSNENKKLYCILVLCMLFNGSLSRSIFDIESDENDEKIYRIMQACGFQRNVSKKELENSAFSAFGSYLSEDGYHFRFIHDALEETVGCHFYKFDPGIMFLDCDISFLRDRVRIQTKRENMNENFDENMVIIQEDELNENHLKPLYNRLSNELSCAGSSCVLMSQLHIGRDFINMPDWKGNTPLHSFLNRLDEDESSDCIKILLENGANPYLCNDDGTFALDLIKSSCDLVIYKNKSESAKFRQTITKTYKIFAVVMFFLMG